MMSLIALGGTTSFFIFLIHSMHIMKIEADSYYIEFYIFNEEEHASFFHYGEVWDDGFTVDNYIVCDCDVYFEDAAWNGTSPTIKNEKKILASQYNRWVKNIEEAKVLIVNMGKNASTSFVSEFKEGDCLYCYIPPYDIEDEDDHEWHSLVEVVAINTNSIKAREVAITQNNFSYSKKIVDITFDEDYWFEVALKTENVFPIERNVFYQAVDIIQQLTNEIISEVKEEFNK